MPNTIYVPTGGRKLPDKKMWTNRFSVPSESSDVDYVIGQHAQYRYWGCSCKGFIYQKDRWCKHMRMCKVPGGMQKYEATVVDRSLGLDIETDGFAVVDASHVCDCPYCPSKRAQQQAQGSAPQKKQRRLIDLEAEI
jgi:hypothetical protein